MYFIFGSVSDGAQYCVLLMLCAGRAGLPPERMCSMFRTVGKILDNLGFSNEVRPPLIQGFFH